MSWSPEGGQRFKPISAVDLVQAGEQLFRRAVTQVSGATPLAGGDLAQAGLSVALSAVLKQAPGLASKMGLNGHGFLCAIGTAISSETSTMAPDVREYALEVLLGAIRAGWALEDSPPDGALKQ